MNGATYDLQSIKLIGDAVGDGATDYIEIWDAGGVMTDTAYYYVTEAQGYEKDGWVTEMCGDTYATNITLKPGEGFFFVANSGDVEVMYAGSVMKGTISVPTVEGYNTLGNSTPVPLDLQSIKLVGEAVGDGATDYIEVWDEGGVMTDTAYYYVTEEQGYEKDGWVTEMCGDTYASDVVYQPGEGFFLVANSGEVKVEIPGALAK